LSPTFTTLTNIYHKKLLMKKSYLLSTWLYYLKLNEKKNLNRLVKITILPVRYKLYTFQKAPMAHKTNSQEHFKFKFFHFNLVFNTTLVSTHYLSSLNSSLLFFYCHKIYVSGFWNKSSFLKILSTFYIFFRFSVL
jgi:hypothetical protein